MAGKRTFEEHKKWYIDAVKSHLVIKAGLFWQDAEKIVADYDLESRIEKCPDIALHDDPSIIARIIKRMSIDRN